MEEMISELEISFVVPQWDLTTTWSRILRIVLSPTVDYDEQKLIDYDYAAKKL